jgi:hypothetical protein
MKNIQTFEEFLNESHKMEYDYFMDRVAKTIGKDTIYYTWAQADMSGNKLMAYIYVPDKLNSKFEKVIKSDRWSKYSEVDFGKGWKCYFVYDSDMNGEKVISDAGLKVKTNGMIY